MRTHLSLALFLLPAALAAQDRAASPELTPAEAAAFEQLSEDYAVEYELIDSWFAGTPIQYYHFGASEPQANALYRVRGGGEVFSSIPGLPGYSALRQFFDVELLPSAGVTASQVHDHLLILELVREGKARLSVTGTTLNLPVVPEGSTLERDPAARPLRQANYRGRAVYYFDFGPHRPSVAPLVAFSRALPAEGDAAEPIEGQPSNASAVPPSSRYSDMWAIMLAVGQDIIPGRYKDYRQVVADAKAGKIELRDRGVVFNCPVVYVDGKPAARPAPFLPPQSLAAAPEEPLITAPNGNGAPRAAPADVPVATRPLAAGSRFHHGRSNALDVHLPRAEGELVIDGVLNEPIWQTASVLTGFSQYEPQDGVPADDSTEVLVWYSEHAIHFGVRAFEPHGADAVRAKLADRDKISADDHVQIFLDTFNDRRRALFFAVNPLGRQADGIRNDRGGGIDAELAEDFQFQSKGRLTDYGYEVEVRIPFKSLRYQAVPVQDWGIHVVREVQHSQHTQTWTPARRAGQSFLAQAGKLKGLTQLKRGLVMDIQPEFTSHVDGAPQAATAGAPWDYGSPKQELGGNMRWGITTNLTMNATANPDFSQVEADVQQVQYDPRSSVSFPEKRPFFVEGSEQFDAPHSLIYTRKIVQPVAALKLNGKAAGASIGLLSAVDNETTTGTPGDSAYPIVNILRLKRDVGPQSFVGLTYTDRVDGGNWSRAAALDTRVVFARLYAFTGSYAHAFNSVNGTAWNAPIWRFNLDRTGRRFGFSYNAQGTHPRFATAVGFVNRTDIATTSINHRFAFFGTRGAALESYSLGVNLSTTWWYDSLLSLREPNDPKLHFNNTFLFRGGWRVTANILLESFRYDPSIYRNYYIERNIDGVTDTVPYVGTPRIQNLDLSTSLNTPQFSNFRGTFNMIVGRDENFEEWAPAFILFPTVTLDWTPHTKVRVNFRYPWQFYVRLTDWSTVRRRQIPRLKLEYQANRAIFFRFVGQYDAHFRDSYRDDSRTGFPVLIRNANGTFRRSVEQKSNNVRWDVLFSYTPNPGTVIFAGYGASMREPEAFTITDLERTVDGFFVKLSYLFRM